MSSSGLRRMDTNFPPPRLDRPTGPPFATNNDPKTSVRLVVQLRLDAMHFSQWCHIRGCSMMLRGNIAEWNLRACRTWNGSSWSVASRCLRIKLNVAESFP